MNELTNKELVALTIKGDQRAAQVLVERYAKPLFGYIYRRVENRETAEDIFQNTFVNVFKSLKRYKEEGNLKAWLFRIAKANNEQTYGFIRGALFRKNTAPLKPPRKNFNLPSAKSLN